MTLPEQILEHIKRRKLIRAGDHILAGVSGGADSMALISLLDNLKTKIGCRVTVAHINHHLRKSANKDERFVRKFCESRNLPCYVVDLDLSKKLTKGGSVEEIARMERFAALGKIAKKSGADKIALAHQKDDLAETVLLRILRGTGLQGLQAILPERKIDKTVFIRPLLDISRKQVEDYLKKNRIPFRTDPTNKQTRFFRNKIRLELLPLIEKNFQKQIKDALVNLATVSAADYDFIRSEALKIFPKTARLSEGKINIFLKRFGTLPLALKRMALRLAVEKIRKETRTLTMAHFTEMIDLAADRPPGSLVHLPEGLVAEKTRHSLIIFRIRN